jgi:polysaccharide export outer membrane protein
MRIVYPAVHRGIAVLQTIIVAALFVPGISGAQTVQISSPPVSDSHAAVARPGDLIRVRIWREPDMSGDYAVDEQGRVALPLIGPQAVAGETRETLLQRLTAAYQPSIRDLSMEVSLLRRVSVTGAVRTPGLYLVDPNLTAVSDAIALAGGISTDAKTGTVQLLRRGAIAVKSLDESATVADLDLRVGDQIFVPEKGYFSRNPTAVLLVAQTIGQLIIVAITLTR